MYNLIEENGLTSSLLAYGILLLFPIINNELPSQREWLEANKEAEAEMDSIIG